MRCLPRARGGDGGDLRLGIGTLEHRLELDRRLCGVEVARDAVDLVAVGATHGVPEDDLRLARLGPGTRHDDGRHCQGGRTGQHGPTLHYGSSLLRERPVG